MDEKFLNFIRIIEPEHEVSLIDEKNYELDMEEEYEEFTQDDAFDFYYQ